MGKLYNNIMVREMEGIQNVKDMKSKVKIYKKHIIEKNIKSIILFKPFKKYLKCLISTQNFQ